MTKQSVSNEVSIVTIPEDQTQNLADITLMTSQSLIDELIRVPTGSFSPYAVYNQHFDSVEAHFKNDEYYTQPLNDNMDLLLSHDNDEIVGVNIHNITKIVPYHN